MTAVELAAVDLDTDEAAVFPHVLAGVVLVGAAARLAAMLDRGFLEEAGWDPRTRVLSLPAEHRLFARTVCSVPQCHSSIHSDRRVCYRCFTRLTGLGMSPNDIAEASELPAAPLMATQCAVPDCRCVPTVRHEVLCQPHARKFRLRRPRRSMEQFLADPRVQPLPPMPSCQVVACTRTADGAGGYCNSHYQRWRTALRTTPQLDPRQWETLESAVAEPGQVNLQALPALVVVEALFGVQQRARSGAKITEVTLRVLCDGLRSRQADSILADHAEITRNKQVRSLRTAVARDIRRALTDPGNEQVKDTWDLTVFGHRGNLSFTGISQPWLIQSVKHWAAEQLPRHRGRGAARVRGKVNGIAMLSENLSRRPDSGLVTAALGRRDIEDFLNRLAHLESAGEISRYRRNSICRDVREVLAGIRALGLTRPGRTAAGIAGDFAIERHDIPAEPERGEPGRDVPLEVLAVLCANLDTLEPAEVRVATQIGIDTGRRPEDILALPVNCLDRDKDGAPVLVYDNAKANRLGRRLPIGETTAKVIIDQQQRVRAKFPDTPISELTLLPTPRRNPHGHKPITIDTLDARHREWITALPVLLNRDGIEVDKAKITPYSYRHCYAQRHADAGVQIDVLAELLDHRGYSMTRRYYRIGEDRRRAAVDTVTALSFDRHGNRIWRDARMLLESERARHAVGEVAVPYGTCTEPINVTAGGGACPVRFRCAGCDHFRTNIAYLPDLQAHLDDLLRTRERLAAAIDGIDDWARADATPAQEEITRIRRLINRIKGDVADLDDTERARVDEAVAIVRRHRAAHNVALGMPTLTGPTTEASA
ncbi:tyrosine-type recombinase/integrase [Mycobacterium riyadhense]|uniref:tyrosine-type recombinase/integrase n=1 Tax=Mycobacterium riyadhense TaxID=486698 RepID=UPI001950C030|nr:tyrosine-type recombinase/integrase [Mycobacterium riyadhense]